MTRSNLLIAFVAALAVLGFAPAAEAHYSPTKGRWLERDPVANEYSPRHSRTQGVAGHRPPSQWRASGGSMTAGRYPDGINLYQYVRSIPIRLVDSLGHESGDPGLWEKYKEGHPDFNPTEKKLWKELSGGDKWCMYQAQKRAFEAVSDPKYSGSTHNGDGDAVRHCVWNCEMSRCLGASGAKRWGDAHEENPGPSDEEDMDKHNNEEGRRLWEEIWKVWKHEGSGGFVPAFGPGLRTCAPTPMSPTSPRLDGECKKWCEKRLELGRLKVLPKERWK